MLRREREVDPPSPDELREATNPETCLAGEDAGSDYIEDAQHWCNVYEELLTFKSSLLDQAARLIQTVSPDAADELKLDEQLLRSQAERYRIRHEFWSRRLSELRAHGDRGTAD